MKNYYAIIGAENFADDVGFITELIDKRKKELELKKTNDQVMAELEECEIIREVLTKYKKRSAYDKELYEFTCGQLGVFSDGDESALNSDYKKAILNVSTSGVLAAASYELITRYRSDYTNYTAATYKNEHRHRDLSPVVEENKLFKSEHSSTAPTIAEKKLSARDCSSILFLLKQNKSSLPFEESQCTAELKILSDSLSVTGYVSHLVHNKNNRQKKFSVFYSKLKKEFLDKPNNELVKTLLKNNPELETKIVLIQKSGNLLFEYLINLNNELLDYLLKSIEKIIKYLGEHYPAFRDLKSESVSNWDTFNCQYEAINNQDNYQNAGHDNASPYGNDTEFTEAKQQFDTSLSTGSVDFDAIQIFYQQAKAAETRYIAEKVAVIQSDWAELMPDTAQTWAYLEDVNALNKLLVETNAIFREKLIENLKKDEFNSKILANFKLPDSDVRYNHIIVDGGSVKPLIINEFFIYVQEIKNLKNAIKVYWRNGKQTFEETLQKKYFSNSFFEKLNKNKKNSMKDDLLYQELISVIRANQLKKLWCLYLKNKVEKIFSTLLSEADPKIKTDNVEKFIQVQTLKLITDKKDLRALNDTLQENFKQLQALLQHPCLKNIRHWDGLSIEALINAAIVQVKSDIVCNFSKELFDRDDYDRSFSVLIQEYQQKLVNFSGSFTKWVAFATQVEAESVCIATIIKFRGDLSEQDKQNFHAYDSEKLKVLANQLVAVQQRKEAQPLPEEAKLKRPEKTPSCFSCLKNIFWSNSYHELPLDKNENINIGEFKKIIQHELQQYIDGASVLVNNLAQEKDYGHDFLFLKLSRGINREINVKLAELLVCKLNETSCDITKLFSSKEIIAARTNVIEVGCYTNRFGYTDRSYINSNGINSSTLNALIQWVSLYAEKNQDLGSKKPSKRH